MKNLFFLCAFLFTCCLSKAQTYSVSSPGKAINVQINTDDDGTLQYTGTFQGRQIIEKSQLGFSFRNEPDLFKEMQIVQTIPSSHHEVWTPVVKSKHAQIIDAYNELVLITEEKTGKRRRMDIIFRVYDDGIAFRYKLYRSDVIGERYLTKELTTFRIPGNPQAWVAEYICINCPEDIRKDKNGNYATSQEGEFVEKPLEAVTDKTIAGLPFLMKYSENCWVAITEAEINNYPGFYIGTNGQKNQLTTKLAPLPNEEEQGIKVHFTDDIQTPWRVIMIGNSPGTLIESEIIQNLNPPCAIADPSWIKPGKSAWDHWWSGEVKMEMPTIKEYINLASEMGWPYMLVDYHWYGDFNMPEADICKSVPQIDIHEIVNYAKSKNVRIWVWLCSPDVTRNSTYKRAFPIFKEWGIAGVKIDFMDRDDQEMVNWYHDIIRTAAENQLLVDFHGAYKPDGIIRTWPNNLTRGRCSRK
ncbi:MAG: glycoside hydrolase family 97 N-terminal domain-containing protein [Mangrovibacterium sp.]